MSCSLNGLTDYISKFYSYYRDFNNLYLKIILSYKSESLL